MKIAVIYYTVIRSMYANSQTAKSELHQTREREIPFLKNIQTKRIKEFKLPELTSKSAFVFRSWNPRNLLEIDKENDSTNVKIRCFVFEVWENDYKADTFVKTHLEPKSNSKN